MVAGYDESNWTAHCLADTYFDGEAGENVHKYSKDARAGAETDPFFYGLTEAERPIHKAREFYLRVLATRLNLVREEWQKVVRNIKKSVSKYEEVSFLLFVLMDDGQATSHGPSYRLFFHLWSALG